MEPIRVAVAGAAGRMGREVVRAVMKSGDLQLAAAIDPGAAGQDAGETAGLPAAGVPIVSDLADALAAAHASVMVDFTIPDGASRNIETALQAGVAAVVGTTGLTEQEIGHLRSLADSTNTPVLIAPNFAIGAVLMMRFAREAAAYFPDAEIIELHHEKKLDSPSGTALNTARLIAEGRRERAAGPPEGGVEKLSGGRGAVLEDVRIHSVRLPGLVAHQEVLFGGPGQTLTIRHDSLDRASFMPGVLLAVRKVRSLKGLVIGLEAVMQEHGG